MNCNFTKRLAKKIPAFLAGVSILAAGLLAAPPPAMAQTGLIRDAEIENDIRQWSTPIFKAARLNPDAVSVYIVNDNTLNAFVSGGQNIFITTGLLMRSGSPGQVIGVIAHETGHIAGGHLARIKDAIKAARAESIIGMILGAGAMIAGGGAGGAAVAMGGQEIANRNFLKYTRGQEGAADQAALAYLDTTGQSARGLGKFMRILVAEQKKIVANPNPYLLTHPLSIDRVANIEDHIAHSPFSDIPEKTDMVIEHARIKAKLISFIKPLDDTLKAYPLSDTSLVARYARAIAYYRVHDLPRALPLIDGLIKEHPEDPYFHELRGQMLFEGGYAQKSLPSYQASVNALPDNALLRVGLARAQLETHDKALITPALKNLVLAVRDEKDNADAWHYLGVAYGRGGHLGMAALSLAEKSLITGDKKVARQQAKRALKILKEGTPSWLRAQDILLAAKKKT